MREAVGLYLNHLALERNLKENSREAYRRDIESLAQFLNRRGVKSWPEVRRTELIEYLGELGRISLAPASVSRHISALRGFFKFLLRERIVASDPSTNIQTPRLFRNLPLVLSIDEIERILDRIDLSQRLGLRDRAAIELLYGCGLRISELISLTLSSLFFEVGHLRVVGKGGRERIVPVGEEASAAVERYSEEERPALVTAESRDALILSRLGKPFSRMGMYKLIQRRVKSAGIARRIKPHTFRHSFASHLIDGGASLRAVQEMLGHADISTTQIYTQLDQSYLKSVHRECHPRERKSDGVGQTGATST